MRILGQFAPFGPGNMKPVFLSHHLQDTGYAKGVGEENKHLKLAVKQHTPQPIGAIGFGLGDKLSVVANRNEFSAVYTLEENVWNGTVNLQLKLKDLRAS